MTWSIVARDPASGAFGVAVTTKFFAVGALCPHAASGTGALATQALINPTFGPRGLRLLREGMPAATIIETLLAGDQGRETRQIHVLDAAGRNAAHTGRDCVGWCGHLLRPGFSVAGNMLAGPRVVEDTAATYDASGHLPFAERLLAALDAGQAAGGDKRGKQSAALRIFAGEEYPWLDIRVDDHAEPLVELRRLYQEARRMYLVFAQFLPTARDPSGVYDRTIINAELARVQEAMKAAT
ncbi:MAG TPA: DUF1028 domain-containing protein [Stellaceae bacterium]|nr:DUF1028 domain-containing protein [Stellaceae bacterium]